MKAAIVLFLLLIDICSYGQLNIKSNETALVDGYLYGSVKGYDDSMSSEQVYTRESVFTFNFRFFDKNANEFYFFIDQDGSWDFISPNQHNDKVIKDFQLKILKENMCYSKPVYCQTGITYVINRRNLNNDITGLIDNGKNIWLHPPRDKLFQILQLNPYPYVKYPLEIGNTWNWKLRIGSGWGDKRWKEWSGVIENVIEYKIVDKRLIKTNVGNLVCFVIESKAKSELGTTKLTSYFNESYGFVRLDYTNIDNSKLEINIQGVQKPIINFLKGN